jgi:ribosomal protein S27E
MVMARLFNLLRCLFQRHEPQRSAVQYDGSSKYCPCRHCGTMLEKRVGGRWMRKRQR